MPDTPNNPAPTALAARIREILHGRSKYAIAGGGTLLAIIVIAGAMSRRATPTPNVPPTAAHAATAAPTQVRPAVATTHPATPPAAHPAAHVVAIASAPPAPPAAAPAASVALPAKPATASTAAVAKPAAQTAGLVSAAMPRPPKMVVGHALETTYALSSSGAWVQTSSIAVAQPRSSFVVHSGSQATRVVWAAWFKISAPTTILTTVLAKGTDGSIVIDVDGVRAFHVKRGAFALTPRSTLVSPLSLAPGWHELSVAYSRKWAWQRSAQITLAAGDGVAAPALLNLNAVPAATAPTNAPTTAGEQP